MSDTQYITPDEMAVLGHLVLAWNAYVVLQVQHPDDLNDFRFHIHALQDLMAARVARRAAPDVFVSAEMVAD